MKLQACHQLFFPTPEVLYLYLRGGRRQVQDLRDPNKAYRMVYLYSHYYFQERDLRALRVTWRLCDFELPADMRYLQPLGDAPDNTLDELLEPVRINFTPPDLPRHSYGPLCDWLEDRLSIRWWLFSRGKNRRYLEPLTL